MMGKKHWYDFGFDHALAGLFAAVKSEKSIKVALLYTIAVMALGIILSISATEWVFLVLALGMIFVAEYLNTALEYAVDLSAKDILSGELDRSPVNENAKLAKDIGAAAALIATIVVGIVSLIIFIPKLIELF
jgi:diacylglycerol kinase